MTLHDNYVLSTYIAIHLWSLSASRIFARALPRVLYPYILEFRYALYTLSHHIIHIFIHYSII